MDIRIKETLTKDLLKAHNLRRIALRDTIDSNSVIIKKSEEDKFKLLEMSKKRDTVYLLEAKYNNKVNEERIKILLEEIELYEKMLKKYL